MVNLYIMRKIIFVAFCLAFVWVSGKTYSQVSKDDIDKAIDLSSLKHPYLYFTEEEKPTLLNRIENDPESNDIFRRLEAEAKMLLHMPVDKKIPIQGKNTRAGWSEYDRDGKYARYYNSNRNNAFNLAFLYQMTG
ncbi:unnamed protein product, partial [marine sediment metagenome]